MKKIIAFVALSLFAASTSFAATTTVAMVLGGTSAKTGLSVYGDAATTSAASTAGTLIGKTSTGVGFGANTGQQAYAIVTQHKSGTRAFGGSYDSTAIVYQTTDSVGVGNPVIANPTSSDFAAFAGWTSM